VQATAVTEGPFLQTGGATFFDGGVIDNVNGVASFTFDTLLGAGPGVTGSGVLESIQFSPLESGPASFSFANLLALDSQLNTITVDSPSASFVAAVPEPSEISLMLAGLGCVVMLTRRRRKGA
jgi:general secretion pathway protein D